MTHLAFADIMAGLPHDGPVVIINVHQDRCDALALLAGLDEPLAVPLPSFTYTKAYRLRDRLKEMLMAPHARVRVSEDVARPLPSDEAEDPENERGCRPAPTARSKALTAILRDLWIDVVKPILDALALTTVRTFNGTERRH